MIDPGSSAGILLFENRWATPFVQALRRGGAELVAAGYIPQDDHRRVARRDRALSTQERTNIMPGLLRGVARTAVIAGTATVVSNRVSRRQANRWSQQEEAQCAASRSTTNRRHPRPPPRRPPDTLTQLQQLGDLKAQGILTDAEFEAQKAKILAS